MSTWAKDRPEVMSCNNRVVSYLPLSHIAGISVDVLTHYLTGHEVYFARPDALQGTIVQTLTWARPTLFFAVPRVWEKFEEKLKEIAASKPAFM
jgi:long-chain-fatty-acid--CoA ligase ACSBG